MLKDPDVRLTAKLPSWNSAYILGLVSARLFKAAQQYVKCRA